MIVRPAVDRPDSTISNGFDYELPPIEAYAEDFESATEPELPTPQQQSVTTTASAIRIRCAADVAATLPRRQYVLRPYIERDAITIPYGDYGVFKSFIVIDWAMRAALGLPALGYTWTTQRVDVVLVSAEGRALPQRLRAWCIRNCPGESYHDVLMRASLYCIEHPVNLSDPASAREMAATIDDLGIVPGLVIIDTMTRNSDGRIEESTASAAAYLAIVDQQIRSRYQCAVVMTHHVGHNEKARIRGPIILAANTDCMVRIERPDKAQRVVSVTIERAKDSEEGETQALRGCVVELGETDEDGQPITSLALEPTEAPPPAPVAGKQPQGKAQRQLLAALRAQDGSPIWTIAEIREVGRKAGMKKPTARSAAEWLSMSPYLAAAVGGWKLATDAG